MTTSLEQSLLLPFRKTPDEAGKPNLSFGDQLLALLADIAGSLRRLAEAHAPDPGGLVGSPYLAKRLGVTTVYVAQMARDGKIPRNCIAQGTGDGKVWKFHRERLDSWIAAGRPEN